MRLRLHLFNDGRSGGTIGRFEVEDRTRHERRLTQAISTSAKSAALAAIIANAKRLLRDAALLQADGSAGSALSLAILAFEEAGKGHIVEHGWEKPKYARSQHSFRHLMAFSVLHASLAQKYGLDLAGVHGKIAKRFTEAGFRPGGKEPIPPMTSALRDVLRAELLPQFERLSAAQLSELRIEQRWLEKVAAALQGGKLEKIRQSGLYLDTDEQFAITSSPDNVGNLEVERWKWATTRVLNLLEHGQYQQSYSPLSELIGAARGGDKEAIEMLATLEVAIANEPDKP